MILLHWYGRNHMKNNNRISVKAVCASITGALMERNEDNFCFNGIGMPEVHDDLEENLTAEVGGQWVAVFDLSLIHI